MTARQRGAALVTCLTVAVVASGCSLLPDAGPKGPSGIDLTRGDYAVVYADSITREAGVATISADGALLQSASMSALGLENWAETDDAIALIGERAADMVVVTKDGTVSTGLIDYPDGTGVTATTFLSDGNLASLVNVGNTETGYANPLVIHDGSGKVLRSTPLQGYFTSIFELGDKLVATGQISHPDFEEDGSRAVVLDPTSLAIRNSWDWPENGGLDRCLPQDEAIICLETEGFKDGARTLLANHLVRIDLATGKKSELTKFRADGVEMVSSSGRIHVATRSTMNLMSADLTKVELELPLAHGDEAIETLNAGAGFIDVFVRDYNRTMTADGRADIGRIVRIDPATLNVVRQTPLQLPDQQLVGVHLIPHEVFEK